MGRAPWRPADVADAILDRSTRPTLPVAALSGQTFEVEVELPGIDEVYIVQPNPDVMQIFVWPMKLHRDRQDN